MRFRTEIRRYKDKVCNYLYPLLLCRLAVYMGSYPYNILKNTYKHIDVGH